MISTKDIDDIIGAEAVGPDNGRIGKVGQVYIDQDSDRPVWVTVKSGLFGTAESLVPLEGANWDDSALRLQFSKDRIKDAPRVEADGELTPEEQQRLYEYYGMGNGSSGVSGSTDDPTASDRDRYTAAGGGEGAVGGLTDDTAGRRYDDGRDAVGTDDRRDAGYDAAGYTEGRGAAGLDDGRDASGLRDDRSVSGDAGHDVSGRNTDDAMTRSEERLHVGTERVEAGRARLRKHIVTERQTVTVPVSHDEVRVEREPITDANRGDAIDGPELSEEEHEVVLGEERPVVNKETVPVERVRLGTETVTEQRQVSEDVRHEEIETDDGSADRTR